MSIKTNYTFQIEEFTFKWLASSNRLQAYMGGFNTFTQKWDPLLECVESREIWEDTIDRAVLRSIATDWIPELREENR